MTELSLGVQTTTDATLPIPAETVLSWGYALEQQIFPELGPNSTHAVYALTETGIVYEILPEVPAQMRSLRVRAAGMGPGDWKKMAAESTTRIAFEAVGESRVGEPSDGSCQLLFLPPGATSESEVLGIGIIEAYGGKSPREVGEFVAMKLGVQPEFRLDHTNPPPDLMRHVPMDAQGRGATFELRIKDGKPHWRWTYDRGLRDDSNTLVSTHVAITRMEKELDLPLTFPAMDPDKPEGKPKPRTQEEDDQNRKRLEKEAAEGSIRALRALWELDGTPITDPALLEDGEVYLLGFDLGVYLGSFVGRRFEDIPRADRYPDVKEWFTFQLAEDLEIREKGSARLSAKEFEGRPMDHGEVYYSVVRPPVSHEVALRVFEQKRAAQRKIEESRGPDRFF